MKLFRADSIPCQLWKLYWKVIFVWLPGQEMESTCFEIPQKLTVVICERPFDFSQLSI